MPWTSNSNLPVQVRNNLTDAQQTIFRQVANNALANNHSEQTAFRMAQASAQRLGKKVATLYLQRKLLNADELVDWAKSRGCEKILDPKEMHVTIAHSKEPVTWPVDLQENTITVQGGKRCFDLLGGSAVVLKFKSPQLTTRWDEMRVRGASWDFDSYMPHVTLSYSGANQHLLGEPPYDGPLIFGPEQISELNEDWSDTVTEKQIIAKVDRVDEDLGIVFGWAIVSKVKGDDYFDLQGDHIPEATVLKASARFMSGDRTAGHMHMQKDGEPCKVGTVVFAFPLTTEISKALKITCHQTGLLLGMKVDDNDILQKFKSGEYTGFSIGGYRVDDEEVLDD